jgi:predicted dehydrogenase
MTHSTAKTGAALLGVTHPHTSGRTRALIERSIPILGAWDDDPAIKPFTKKFGMPNRSLEAILGDPDVGIILIHSKSQSMVSLASAALRAGKAVLVEKPGGKSLEDLEALVQVLDETNSVCQVGYSSGSGQLHCCGGWRRTGRDFCCSRSGHSEIDRCLL